MYSPFGMSDVQIDRWNTLFKYWQLKHDFSAKSSMAEFLAVQLNMFEEITIEIENLKKKNTLNFE